jgi:hypothetical protein
MSVPAFTRFFRKSTGKTFVEYLTELRVGSACAFWWRPTGPVTQICYAAGFNNLSNFNRRFAISRASPRGIPAAVLLLKENAMKYGMNMLLWTDDCTGPKFPSALRAPEGDGLTIRWRSRS